MMSFLGSYKTEISNSLKQFESRDLEGRARVQKNQQENQGPSPFQIAYS